MTAKFSHYFLTPEGELEMEPAATTQPCLPYLLSDDRGLRLCVIEGGAFHNFSISLAGVARLADEATAILRTNVTKP